MGPQSIPLVGSGYGAQEWGSGFIQSREVDGEPREFRLMFSPDHLEWFREQAASND